LIKPKKTPLVSIIIRTRNEEDWIESCLNAIEDQNYKTSEVIIVDNYSNDKTLNILKKFNVKIIKIKKFYPGKAINEGVKASKGKVIICLSAHCIPTNKYWLENLVKGLTNKKVGAVYGRQEPMSYSSAINKRDLLTVFGLDKKIQKKDPFFHNANSAFKKEIWNRFNFDENVTNVEDRLWGRKLIDNSLNIIYEPKASVFHWHGINQDLNPDRAESIIKILERENNFFEYTKLNNLKINKGLGIIPIRGKDIKDFIFIDKTIEILKKIKSIHEIYVTTDDKKILDYLAIKNVKCILRPHNLSNKFIDIFDVTKFTLKEILKKDNKGYQFVMIMQVDYPFRNFSLINKMLNTYITKNHTTLIASKKDSRGFSIVQNRKIKNITYDNIIPQNLKNDDLIIFLVGLCSITRIEEILNNSWRYNKINTYNVEDQFSLKMNDFNKVKDLMKLSKDYHE
jgi:rhamnosyltransferase|tara:strand:+ start:117 stop:1478 length:1362 start_codon:yes stop_codon:yes gene_type:complete